MKVLMLVPPFVKGFMRNARWDAMTISGTNWYPIFMAYCTGLLEKAKHQVKLLDAQVDRLTPQQVHDIAQEFSPELTVIYYSMKSLDNDTSIGERVSELTGSQVVLVGHAASFDPLKTLSRSPQIDMLAKGEFDFTVLDLANKVPREQVKGLVWKDGKGQIHENAAREPIPEEELDKYPFVTDVYRRHLNINNYWNSVHYHPYIDLFTGRGCSWGWCSFCLWPHTMYGGPGPKYRKRSIGNVMEELRFIREEMPYIKDVYFQDDTLPKERAIEISEAILQSGLKMRWSSYSRANLDLNTLKLMKRAGCYLVEVGFESSSNEILKNIKKGVSVEITERFAREAAKAGITVVGAFIIGLPGETPETIRATIDWLNKLPILRYTITLPKPYPGTSFYAYLEEKGYLKDGRPNYPNLSSEDIYCWNKWALRRSYLNPRFFLKMLVRPHEWGHVSKAVGYFLPYVFSKENKFSLELEW